MTAILQTVQQEAQMLSDDLLIEVLDFIYFLRNGQSEESFLWQQVEDTYAQRRRYPNTVITASADEFLSDTADLDND